MLSDDDDVPLQLAQFGGLYLPDKCDNWFRIIYRFYRVAIAIALCGMIFELINVVTNVKNFDILVMTIFAAVYGFLLDCKFLMSVVKEKKLKEILSISTSGSYLPCNDEEHTISKNYARLIA